MAGIFPVDVGPQYEGEVIRKGDMHVEFGGPNAKAKFELVTLKSADEVENEKIEVIGPDISEMEEGSSHSFAMIIDVAGAGLEKDMIYMTDVPDGFVHITSGLGKANPTAILITPLMINEKIEGVIELASFHEFEAYKIEFIKKLSENIASTISNVNTNNRTRKLLEESQDMTEQLRQQEEELRQNTEELHVSQENLNMQLEEAKREMQLQIEIIEAEKQKNIAILEGCEDGVVTFKSDGIIDFVNRAAEETWELPKEEIQGKHIKTLMPVEIDKDDNVYRVYDKDNGSVQNLDTRTEIKIYNSNKEEISVLATLSEGRVNDESTFAFFIQRISVEFF